jgi:hypothetical protein
MTTDEKQIYFNPVRDRLFRPQYDALRNGSGNWEYKCGLEMDKFFGNKEYETWFSNPLSYRDVPMSAWFKELLLALNNPYCEILAKAWKIKNEERLNSGCTAKAEAG